MSRRTSFGHRPVFHWQYTNEPGWQKKQTYALARHHEALDRWKARKTWEADKTARKARQKEESLDSELIVAMWEMRDLVKAKKKKMKAGKQKRDAARLRWLAKKDATAKRRYSWKK